MSRFQYIGDFKADWPQDIIKNEPMFFNCDVDFCLYNGGPITTAFIAALPLDWKDNGVVIDSRVHMLMPNWYPCIPGWHHDDVARGKNGQPNYKDMPYRAQHVMGLVNGDICPTKFAIGEFNLPLIESGTVYKEWHKAVEKEIGLKTVKEVSAESGRLIQFDWQTFHSGQKAIANGWRWFCRVSRGTDRTKSITNELRRQSQVYLEFPMEGW